MNQDQEQQTTEVRETSGVEGDTAIRRQSVAISKSVGPGVIASRVVYYIAGIIIALLALRVVLLVLAANQGTPFVDFVYGLSGVFAAPFYGIFSYEPAYGKSVFEISSIVGIVVYGLVASGLAKLFTLTNRSGDAEV